MLAQIENDFFRKTNLAEAGRLAGDERRTFVLAQVERLLTEMTIVMEYLDTISVGKCRMIAMETAALWHNGVKMNGRYTIQNMPERTIDGYKFLALYYCSFFKVFPNMIDKLGLPYEDICLKALERYNGYKQKP